MGSKEAEFVNTLEDGVRILRFNRPKRLNALSSAMFINLIDSLLEAGRDPQTVITVLTGTGDYFTSGNDLGNFAKGLGEEPSPSANDDLDSDEGKLEMIKRNGVNKFETLVKTLIEFPKPIVAVVNGPAVGIGVTMLALLDVVYASDRATFHTPFTKLGLSPEGCSSYLFPRIMGHGKAAEMLLFSKKITAADAFQHHLVTEVFPDDCLHQVWPRIKAWAKLPPNTLASAKSILSEHRKERLLGVNRLECDRLAVMFTKEEFITSLMKAMQQKSKL